MPLTRNLAHIGELYVKTVALVMRQNVAATMEKKLEISSYADKDR